MTSQGKISHLKVLQEVVQFGLVDLGMTRTAIAIELCLSRAYISQVAISLGFVGKSRRRVTDAVKAKMFFEGNRSVTNRELSKRLQIGVNTVTKYRDKSSINFYANRTMFIKILHTVGVEEVLKVFPCRGKCRTRAKEFRIFIDMVRSNKTISLSAKVAGVPVSTAYKSIKDVIREFSWIR